MHTGIAMARSLRMLGLAVSISSVTGAIITPVIITPVTCTLKTVPTDGPPYDIPTYCDCSGFGLAPTSSPTVGPLAGQTVTGDALCQYAPIETINPTPITCNLQSATAGFTVPGSWCGCTAGTSTGTYSTKLHQTGTAACKFFWGFCFFFCK